MVIRNTAVSSLVAGAVLVAAPTALGQQQQVWSQSGNGTTAVQSAKWTTPSPYDVEFADDFDYVGPIVRVIANGSYIRQIPPPAAIDGVHVRFYAWANGAPGALLQETFVPEGAPGLVHQNPPTLLDVTLPQPFAATGKHFVSVQFETPHVNGWRWGSANDGSPVMGSVHRRDRAAGGGWSVYRTLFGQEIDLSFDLWTSGGSSSGNDPCGPWEVLPTPPLPADYDDTTLEAMSVVDYDDVWVVGGAKVEVGFQQFVRKNYALHWDGQQWTRIATPNPSVFSPPFGATGLEDVDALRSDFVWAVGNWETRDGLGFIIDQPLLLRWDGTAWTQVTVPNTNFDTFTYGVALLEEDDAWIVGGGLGTACGGGLAIHYDGSRFTPTTTPGPGCGLAGGTPGFDLVAVDGVAGDDVWAVGGGSDGDFSGTTYVLHWDGSTWSHTPAPTPGFARRLFDVHARAADDVWAVGQYQEIVGGSVQYRAWAIHWDGTSWTLHDGASAPIGADAVYAFAPNDVYTGGDRIYHWDGASWSVADELGQSSGATMNVAIHGLDAPAPCHLWASGRQTVAGLFTPLTARHVGTDYWKVTARGCAQTAAPEHGISLVSPPKIGTTFAVAIGDPQAQTGFTPGSTQTAWVIGTMPPAGGNCSATIPGFGLGGGPGALLVELTTAPALITPTQPWGGPGKPAIHSVAVPAVSTLIGADLATQGVLIDVAQSSPLVLTDALDATLGR